MKVFQKNFSEYYVNKRIFPIIKVNKRGKYFPLYHIAVYHGRIQRKYGKRYVDYYNNN